MLLRPEISRVVGGSILITGPARSGTSILSTLVHSLGDVELVFEPPFLYGLFPQLGKMDAATWKLLYETYLFEDFLMDALAGRRVNLNNYDESGIRRAKSELDVESRLNSRARRQDLFPQALFRKIAFKMPDVLPYLHILLDYFPRMKIVALWREPEAVVDSLLKRQWFAGHQRMSDVLQGPWRSLSPDIPFWVPEGEELAWGKASVLERAYMYYLWQTEALVRLRDRGIYTLDYDDLVRQPAQEFERVADYLAAKPGPQTATLLRTVERGRSAPSHTLDTVRQDLKERTIAVLKQLQDG